MHMKTILARKAKYHTNLVSDTFQQFFLAQNGLLEFVSLTRSSDFEFLDPLGQIGSLCLLSKQ